MTRKGPGGDAATRTWQRVAAVRSGGPGRFAQALVRRHVRAVRRVAGLTLPLAAPRAMQMHVAVSRAGDSMTRWELKVQAIVQRVRDMLVRVERAGLPAGDGMPPAARALPASPSPGEGPVAQSAMANAIPRLVARGRRIESAVPAPVQVLQASPARLDTRVLPTARTADRPGPDLPAVRARMTPSMLERSAREGEETRHARGAAPRSTATVAPAALPQQEIARIAEQVMDSIDRRILAERERRGRF